MTKIKPTKERFRVPKYCKICGRRLFSQFSRLAKICVFCYKKSKDNI